MSAADLESAPEQILGYHSDDPPAIPGTTSLGPSRRLVRELLRAGSAAYSFRNFVTRGTVSGTLQRSPALVKFPMLIDGRRVELEAVRATGEMSLGGVSRPFETVILDHPTLPLSLRIAYGPRNGAAGFMPVFAREIVRIDLPAPALSTSTVLERECRVELRGVYFDFNRATIKPESADALREIAAALPLASRRRFVIEGHTDGIGSERYN